MRYNAKVLYVMDGNFSEFETLKQVLDLAEEYQLELTLFEIADTIAPSARLMVTSMPLNNLEELTLRNRHRRLEALVSIIGPRSFKLRARTSFGNRAKEIVSEATKGNYEFVIKRRERGSADKRVLRNCQCPVWVLKPEDYTESGQIIVSDQPKFAPKNENRTAHSYVHRFSGPED
jgi:hypothetical protein